MHYGSFAEDLAKCLQNGLNFMGLRSARQPVITSITQKINVTAAYGKSMLSYLVRHGERSERRATYSASLMQPADRQL